MVLKTTHFFDKKKTLSRNTISKSKLTSSRFFTLLERLAFRVSKDLKSNIFQNYIVYYTENPNAHLSLWERITVRGRRVVFPDLRYDWFYTFCATACFKDGQRSPLSRALFVKTDKLEFRPKCSSIYRFLEILTLFTEIFSALRE